MYKYVKNIKIGNRSYSYHKKRFKKEPNRTSISQINSLFINFVILNILV